MKRIIFFLLVAAVLLLPACSVPSKTPGISEAATARLVNPKTSKPILLCEKFTQYDPSVYFTVKVKDLPGNTKLRALWRHIDSGTEIPSEIITEGTGYEVFSLKRNADPFPAGQYEVVVNSIVEGQALESKAHFSIVPGTESPHLLNPVTSKSVSNEDKLNPVNITSEFSQSDPMVYFVITSKNLPKDTKVSCLWLHIDSDERLTYEITTDGSRNIVFSLKPGDSQRLPEGNYIVMASADINDCIESVWAEFKVTK